MKKAIIVLILLTALLFPKIGLASVAELEIQILKIKVQILELQIKQLLIVLNELLAKQIEPAVEEEIPQEEVIEEIPEIEIEPEPEIIIPPAIPPHLEYKCPSGGRYICA